MKRSQRLGGAVGGGCLLLAAVGLVWPTGTPTFVIESGPSPTVSSVIVSDDDMDRRVAARQRKTALKDELVDDLLAGRRSLTTAVVRLQEMEGEFPEFAGPLRSYLEHLYPGCPYEECLARSLLSHCEVRLQNRSELPSPSLDRLKAELAICVPRWRSQPPLVNGPGPAKLHTR
jgi:hypothetical protein